MAHKNLDEAIMAVQRELRSLSDHARFSEQDEYTQDLFAAVDALAAIVEGLVRGVDYPVQAGQSLQALE